MAASGRGKHNTSLEERLKARGKWAGAGGEAVTFSVRQPDAAVAMLLLGDGDPRRVNRTFLLRDDLKVRVRIKVRAGVGLRLRVRLRVSTFLLRDDLKALALTLALIL